MSVNLYRLYAVQSFNGEEVAVYVNTGNYPDSQLLSDADDIASGNRTRAEVLKDSYYDPQYSYPDDGKLNRKRLTFYTRILKRAKKVVDENKEINKAIFVWDDNKQNWRGKRDLYENKIFDEIKCDTPEYTACTHIGEIFVGR